MKMESKRSQAALRRIVCLVVLTALLCALPVLGFAENDYTEDNLGPRSGVYGWYIARKSDGSPVGGIGYPGQAGEGNTAMDLGGLLQGFQNQWWEPYETGTVDLGPTGMTLIERADYEAFSKKIMSDYELHILLIDVDSDKWNPLPRWYPYVWVTYPIIGVSYDVDPDALQHTFTLQVNSRGRDLWWDYSERYDDPNHERSMGITGNRYKAVFSVTATDSVRFSSNQVTAWGAQAAGANEYLEGESIDYGAYASFGGPYDAVLQWPYIYKTALSGGKITDAAMKGFVDDLKKNYRLRVTYRDYSNGYDPNNPDASSFSTSFSIKDMKTSKIEDNYVIFDVTAADAPLLRWHWHDGYNDTSSNWNEQREYNVRFRIGVHILPAVSDATAKKHLVTENVVNPPYTTVNFFDYWLEPGGRWDNDFERYPQGTEAEVITKGINNDHLLVFMGSFAFPGAVGAGNVSDLGRWNVWTGDQSYAPYPDGGDLAGGFGTPPAGSFTVGDPDGILKPHRGIVQRKLVGGYPKLALGGAAWMTTDTHFSANRNRSYGNEYPDEMGGNFRTFYSDVLAKDGGNAKGGESLAYLFDPGVSHPYKASVTDARGLFQLDNEGYFYYNSRENFAELVEHGGSDGSNIVNLYDEPWKVSASVDVDNASSATKGQFFPFNNWKSLFHETANGGVAQDHYTFRDQNRTTGLPLNHYFGMTVETEFGQPVDGIVKSSNARATGREMEFYFSGDDDAWVFIDDVLVGDIGGIHTPVSIDINFATGNIRYTALDAPGGEQQYYTTTLKQMFDDAGATGVQWKKAKSGGYIFPDGSTHTLKFFYMERGNDVSNCSLRFNTLPWEDGSGVPATGDSSHMPLWLTLIALFLCAMAASLILPYRRRPSSARGE